MLKTFLRRKVPKKEKKSGPEDTANITFKKLEKLGRFPWSKPKRVIKRKGFDLTLFLDGSRLYTFKEGGFFIVSPEGSKIIKANPRLIKKYLRGEKMHLTSGGNSDIKLVIASERPIVVKEHKSGVSPQSQMEHSREISKKISKNWPNNSTPKYYAVGEFIQNNKQRQVSVMEYMYGTKVSELVEGFDKVGDTKSMRMKNKLLRDYKRFEQWLKSKKLPLTDLHEGNVLASYNRSEEKFTFSVIDQ